MYLCRMDKKQTFKGAGAAIVSPFHNDLSIDYEALEKTIEHLIAGNIDFIVLLGSTGEASTIKKNDQEQMINFASAIINNRVPLIIGCSGNSTTDVIERVREISKLKIDGILSASPYYNKPSQEGIYRHFKAVAESTDLPLIIYNVPGRTVSNILPETCLRLANDIGNIVAIKEASGNMDQVMKIIKDKPEGFTVLSGEDALNVPLMSVGVEGSISVVANAFPELFSKMIHHAANGNFTEAEKIHYQLLDFTFLMFKEGNPSGIKAAMNILGLCENVLRPPLLPVSDTLYNEIKDSCKEVASHILTK